MQEPNVLRTSGDPLLERATTIPTAPAAPLHQPVPEPQPLPATPGYSPARRTTSMTRLLLIRLMRGLSTLGHALWPYRLTLGVAVFLLAIIGWMGALLWAAAPAAPGFSRVDSIPPALAVENFIKGQQSYDGALMWESFSEQLKAQLLSRGDSKATWEARAEMNRRSGQVYRQFSYVGGVKLQDGNSMYFYLADVESPRPEASGPTSFVFTVDEDGKILGIELAGND